MDLQLFTEQGLPIITKEISQQMLHRNFIQEGAYLVVDLPIKDRYRFRIPRDMHLDPLNILKESFDWDYIPVELFGTNNSELYRYIGQVIASEGFIDSPVLGSAMTIASLIYQVMHNTGGFIPPINARELIDTIRFDKEGLMDYYKGSFQNQNPNLFALVQTIIQDAYMPDTRELLNEDEASFCQSIAGFTYLLLSEQSRFDLLTKPYKIGPDGRRIFLKPGGELNDQREYLEMLLIDAGQDVEIYFAGKLMTNSLEMMHYLTNKCHPSLFPDGRYQVEFYAPAVHIDMKVTLYPVMSFNDKGDEYFIRLDISDGYGNEALNYNEIAYFFCDQIKIVPWISPQDELIEHMIQINKGKRFSGIGKDYKSLRRSNF
jgi:hypothetical protein